MKIAVIHDSLVVSGGSERVFLNILEEFKEADVYTLAYNPKKVSSQFKNYKIKTSFLNPFIKNHTSFRAFFPIATYLMQHWDFSKYDLIITSSATTAKYISKFKGKHICYCYYPTRAIWECHKYFNSNDLKGMAFRAILPYFQERDLAASKRVDKFIGISQESAKAIENYYGKKAEMVFSPIDYEKFKLGLREKKSDNYLIVSRLVHWKKLEYAIEAFNQCGAPLKIIGTGSEEKKLTAMAKNNIMFLGNVDDATLVKEYGKARALIFTPELEYGLTPIEANAAGTPVIAYGKGAVLETMIPYNPSNKNATSHTAVFFDHQTPESIIDAIKIFENLKFDRHELTKHASQFGIELFRKKLRSIVNSFCS